MEEETERKLAELEKEREKREERYKMKEREKEERKKKLSYRIPVFIVNLSHLKLLCNF